MAGPIRHHLAGGIHPGAFVQSDAPATIDVQDGVLWVDTSTAAPYRVWVWNATEAAGWELTGMLGAPPTPTIPLVPGQSLTLVPQGMQLVPQWQPCCAEGAISPAPVVTPAPVNVRCGAALALARALSQAYDATRYTADAAYSGGIVSTLASILASLSVGLGSLIAFSPTALIQGPLSAIGRNILDQHNITLFPALSLTQQDEIQQAAYCALPAGINAFSVTRDVVDAWISNLSDPSNLFVEQQLPTLLDLVEAVPPQGWATVAYVGAQTGSNTCKSYTCKKGHALSGGALVGPKGHALRGGGLLSADRKSLSGGAFLGRSSQAMQGGAHS